MAIRRGAFRVVAGLLILVIALASTTAYLGFLDLQSKSNGNTGSTLLGQNIVVSSLPGVNGALSSAQTSAGTPANSITVSGTGQATYSPNEALLSVSVVSSAATAEGATSNNAATTTKVIDALNSIGIDNSSIKTQGYNLYPNYANSYGSSVPPTITSYTVTNSLLVNITATSASQLGLRAGQAIDTAVTAGANQISLQFAPTSSLLAHLNNLALQAAIASAAGQAQVMARSLGVNITGVISAVQGYTPYYSQGPYYYGSFASSAAVSTPVIPGTQSNSATVTIAYAIS